SSCGYQQISKEVKQAARSPPRCSAWCCRADAGPGPCSGGLTPFPTLREIYGPSDHRRTSSSGTPQLLHHPVLRRRQVRRIEDLVGLWAARQTVAFDQNGDATVETRFVDVAEAFLEHIRRENAAFHGELEPIALNIGVEQWLVFQRHLHRLLGISDHFAHSLDAGADETLHRIGMFLEELRRCRKAVAIEIESVVAVEE